MCVCVYVCACVYVCVCVLCVCMCMCVYVCAGDRVVLYLDSNFKMTSKYLAYASFFFFFNCAAEIQK